MKKLSTTIRTKSSGASKTVFVYVDDETAKALDGVSDEQYKQGYLLEELRSQYREEWRCRRTVSMDKLSDEGHELASSDILPDKFAEMLHNKEALAQSIKRLTPQQQEVIVQVFYEKETQVEIAKMHGVHKTAVSKQLQRALKRLKKYLDKF